MAAAWPSYATFRAERRLAQDPDVRRTTFGDGAVRQERVYTAAPVVRSIEARLDSDADLVRFRAWAAANAATYFAWRDPEDNVLRNVRVRGGNGGVRYQSDVSGGVVAWTATMELEGRLADTVAESDG